MQHEPSNTSSADRKWPLDGENSRVEDADDLKRSFAWNDSDLLSRTGTSLRGAKLPCSPFGPSSSNSILEGRSVGMDKGPTSARRIGSRTSSSIRDWARRRRRQVEGRPAPPSCSTRVLRCFALRGRSASGASPRGSIGPLHPTLASLLPRSHADRPQAPRRLKASSKPPGRPLFFGLLRTTPPQHSAQPTTSPPLGKGNLKVKQQPRRRLRRSRLFTRKFAHSIHVPGIATQHLSSGGLAFVQIATTHGHYS